MGLKDRFADTPVLGTALTVQDRYVDDLGNHLAASIAFFGFLSLFPLLLVALAVTGSVLADDPRAQGEVVERLAASVPGLEAALGDAIDTAIRTRGVTGVVGLVGVLFAGLRVVNGATVAVSRVFRVEDDANVVVRKARAVGNLLLLGSIALLAASASAVTGAVGDVAARFGIPEAPIILAAPLLSFVLDVALFVVAYRVLTAARGPTWPHLWPGALLAAAGWTALKVVGATYVGNQAAQWNALYGALGGIIAAMLLLFLAGRVLIYGAELNAVRLERSRGPLGGAQPHRGPRPRLSVPARSSAAERGRLRTVLAAVAATLVISRVFRRERRPLL